MAREHLIEAVRLARDNARRGGRPFGAVVVKDGRVVARGVNETARTHDPTAHAELLALRAAGAALGTPCLEGAVVYASGHPCPMCLAAACMAGVTEIRYAASLEDGAPYGLGTAGTYAALMRPFDELPVRLVHEPVHEEGAEDPYALWARLRSGG